MSERLLVDEPARLLDFLRQRLVGWKRKTLEQRIREGCVRVNGADVSRRDHALARGDEVLVLPFDEGHRPGRAPAGISIVYTDDDLVAIDKPAGLLSVSTDDGRERNALALVREFLSRPGKPARLWPVHRLDRESSGVLLFAKSRSAREAVQNAWTEARKVYLAIVEGRPEPPHGVIDEPLWEDQNLHVRVGNRPGAKAARTRYSTVRTVPKRALLEVELETGRRHQIRAHLAWLGHPIVGDPRYGIADSRMGLHALRLVVPHPADGRRLQIDAPPPGAFLALLTARSE